MKSEAGSTTIGILSFDGNPNCKLDFPKFVLILKNSQVVFLQYIGVSFDHLVEKVEELSIHQPSLRLHIMEYHQLFEYASYWHNFLLVAIV